MPTYNFTIGDQGVAQMSSVDGDAVTREKPNDVAVLQGGEVSEMRAGPEVQTAAVDSALDVNLTPLNPLA